MCEHRICRGDRGQLSFGVFQRAAAGGAGDMYRRAMGSWGIASFENDAAADWFLLVEEAVDPGRGDGLGDR